MKATKLRFFKEIEDVSLMDRNLKTNTRKSLKIYL